MLSLKLFGGLTVEGQPVSLSGRAAQRKRLAVLALVGAASRSTISRDKVVGMLWPESSADRARHMLSSSVHELRRALGDGVLLATRDELQLAADAIRCDVAEFRDAMRDGAWARAIDLYSGPFLDGVFLSGAPEFDQWVDTERAVLARELARALEEEATRCSAAGDFRAAVSCWHRLAVEDSLNSRIALGLMRALASAGDRAGAIAHGARHEAVLHDAGIAADPVLRAFADLLHAPDDGKARGLPGAERDAYAVSGVGSAPFALAADARLGIGVSAPPIARNVVPPAPSQPRSQSVPRASRPRVATLAAAVALLSLPIATSFMPLPTRNGTTDGFGIVQDGTAPMRIAVLPLLAIDAAPRRSLLSTGLSEELRFALSRIPELRVLGRNSTAALEDGGRFRASLVTSLRLRWLLEGGIRERGDTVQVTVRLLDARSGFEEWSERFERPLGDALALQQEIAARVASRVMQGGYRDRGLGEIPRTATAVEHYLRGRVLLRVRSAASQQAAIAAFTAALATAPDYARGHAALSEAYNIIAEITGAGTEQEDLLRRAETSARRALALDVSLGEAHTSLGNVLLNQWRWQEARDAFHRGVEANPGLATAHLRYGITLALLGDFGEATTMTLRAKELDPLDPDTHGAHAYVLVLAGRFAEAERVARGLLAMTSNSESAHFWIGTAVLHQGRLHDAIRHFTLARGLSASPQRALPMLGYTLARAGRLADARALRDTIFRGIASKAVSPYHGVAYLAAIGERDQAFRVLTSLARRRESCLRDLGVDPLMVALHDDARFSTVITTVGGTVVVR